jgi:hypothetical protein
MLWIWLAFLTTSTVVDWIRFTDFASPPPPDTVPPEYVLSLLFIQALCTALLMAAVLLADAAVDAGTRRFPAYAVAVTVSVGIAAWLQWVLRPLLGLRVMVDMPGVTYDEAVTQPLVLWLEMGLRSGLLVALYANVRSTQQARQRLREAEYARARARRQTLASRLLAMQARIEPQVLFNTLTRVGALYETDTVRAGNMLDDLIAYLRAALPHLRDSTSTLGKETGLAQAYLNIMRIAPEGDLPFAVSVPAALQSAPVPPMILLPLVEHARLCLVQAAAPGGQLQLMAHATGERLQVCIRCAGDAFDPAHDNPVVASITERLAALFGTSATLALVRVSPTETEVMLELPG